MALRTSDRPSDLSGHFLIWSLLLLIGWNYFNDARLRGSLTSASPPSYYGLLTEALISGQVHLKLIPDPKLLRLADPYAGPQGVERPHDMTFYRGKFYLYYGITPALVLMVPWRLLTGSYLSEVATSATLCYAGFLLAALWLLHVRQRYFSTVSVGWTLLGLGVLGLGSPIYFLGNNPTFYAVPIAGAFFCLMLTGAFVDRTARALTHRAALIWLSAASLTAGLAVGARPNYVLSLLLLLIPAVLLWKKTNPTPRRGVEFWRIAAASILPAAFIGFGLALYNYLRFGDPTEFGIRYSLSTVNVSTMRLMGFEFYPKNLWIYLLQPADFIRYFPFLHSDYRPFGVLTHLTLAGAAVLLPLTWLSRRLRQDHAWFVSGLFWLGAAISNLAILCLFFGGVDRYLVDFAPPALLIACALILAGVHVTQRWTTFPRLLGQTALAALVGWTLLNGFSFALSQRVSSPLLTFVEKSANRAVATLESFGASTHGPIELKLRFPANATGRREPLLSTGTLAGTGDIVYVRYSDERHVQFGFFHLGAGGPLGPPVAVDYAKEHTLTIHLGSLYPPRQHPLFETWTEPQVNKARRRLEVTLDGQPALQASVNVYPSTPDGVHLAANPLAPDVTSPNFTGQILASRRLGASPPVLPPLGPTGPVRLTVKFPPSFGGAPLPLISTGQSGSGDLLSIQLLADGRVRFIHDCWGSSDYTSEAISITPQVQHVIEIEMGSLYPEQDASINPALRHRLAVWIDQKPVMDLERPFNAASPDSIEFGFNAIEASSAIGMFTGTLLKVERIPAHPLAALRETWGPLELDLRFPTDATGLNEPLVSAGRSGAADIVIVNYPDRSHVRFGLYQSGETAPLWGPLIAINYSNVYAVTITLGSLYPPADDPTWRNHPGADPSVSARTLEIRLDGQIALRAERTTFPARPDQVSLGRNDLDASRCQRVFSGKILDHRRLAW